jgi:hypothetical protein
MRFLLGTAAIWRAPGKETRSTPLYDGVIHRSYFIPDANRETRLMKLLSYSP